jgi:hypothetical protein
MGGVGRKASRCIALLLVKTSVSIGIFNKGIMYALGYYVKLFFAFVHDSE